MATTNYTVTIRSMLRTLTINQDYTHTVATASLSADCDAAGADIRAAITTGSLTAKSLQGHLSFAPVSGRTLGGQTTYHTEYNAAGSQLNKAVANTVEPEHRIAFALNETDLASANAISAALQRVINEGLYEGKLYKH